MAVSASSQQVTVFGANGRVGRLVVAELLARGYHVNAFVHRRHDFAADPQLTIIHGDIYSSDDVRRAVKGSNAIVSALGSWGTPKQDILTAGITNIIPAMQDEGTTRIVSLTGADARASGDELSALHKMTHRLLGMIAPKILSDGEKHISLLEQSALDWTVVRSPAMIGGKKTSYVLSSKRSLPWAIVRRHAVATTMVDLMQTNEQNQCAPFVRNK